MPTVTNVISTNRVSESPIECQEEHGCIIRYTCQHMLETDAVNEAILSECLSHADMPQYGDSLDAFPNLVCVERRVRAISGRNSAGFVKVSIDCTYVDSGQLEDSGALSGGSNVEQIETSTDYFNTPISVAHTFVDDPQYGSGTYTQGGTIRPTDTFTTIQLPIILERQYPNFVSSEWVNKVNSRPWYGNAFAGKWKCSNVSFKPLRASTTGLPKWKFLFEFQFNPQFWSQTILARYTNSDGSIPAGLVPGVGIVAPLWYQSKDFHELFPTV